MDCVWAGDSVIASTRVENPDRKKSAMRAELMQAAGISREDMLVWISALKLGFRERISGPAHMY
jgi:hypothetical protein